MKEASQNISGQKMRIDQDFHWRLSLSAPYSLNEVEWSLIYDVWKQMKIRKPLSLGKLINVLNNNK